MATAREILQGSLKLIGVLDPLESMSADDAADGLLLLNDVVDLWASDRVYLPSTSTVSATVLNGSATVGPAGTFSVAQAPARINHAFSRIAGVDEDVSVVSDRTYDQVQIKNTATTRPQFLRYVGTAPLSTITLWPAPASVSLHINIDTPLTAFATLDTDYDLPQGYRLTLKYVMTEHLAPLFQKPIPAVVDKTRAALMRSLKRGNFVMPELEIETYSDGGQRLGSNAAYAAFLAG